MILVENKVIIAVMDNYKQMTNGKLINDAIYPMGEVVDIDVPSHVVPQKYCYDSIDGVYQNPDYVEYKTPEQIAEEVESLGMMLFNTQTELLQTQQEKDQLGQQLFELQTKLIMKGVL